jgi:hypothetical protein
MGILGFLLGAFASFLIRSAQSMVPAWDPEVGIVLGTIVATVIFVWQMGAFDPRMSAHGEEHEEHEGEAHAAEVPALPTTTEHAAEAKPRVPIATRLQDAAQRLLTMAAGAFSRVNSPNWIVRIVQFVIALVIALVLLLLAVLVGLALLTVNTVNWMGRISTPIYQITLATVLLVIAIIAFATLPFGPTIRITNDPVGSPSDVGFITINLFGSDVVFSKLTIFIIFVVWTIVSLAIAAGMISMLMSFVARNLKEVKGKPATPAELTPPAPVRLLGRIASWLLERLPEPPQPRKSG